MIDWDFHVHGGSFGIFFRRIYPSRFVRFVLHGQGIRFMGLVREYPFHCTIIPDL